MTKYIGHARSKIGRDRKIAWDREQYSTKSCAAQVHSHMPTALRCPTLPRAAMGPVRSKNVLTSDISIKLEPVRMLRPSSWADRNCHSAAREAV